MANELADRFAETLLDRISQDKYPSNTHMDMLEAVASPRMRVAFALHLMERIEDENYPSIPMMQRAQRLVASFG